MLALALEVLALVPTAIQLGLDITDTVERVLNLADQPTPATPEQLDGLRIAIAAERQRLADLTVQLDTDPPEQGG